MMRQRYRISELAISDLEKIWLYTLKKWSLKQADRYHSLIISEIEFIAAHFSLSTKIEHIREGYRMSKVKSHLIFYKMAEDGVVEIVRILYQSMDIENRLKEK
ncbi:type II toxin-antitoxin system RelE/ParE family toxin [Labilibacter sediminis]|nr:type II toxin-antitoxin system RelE/ParE family toxin [Labilibacter sediminis]